MPSRPRSSYAGLIFTISLLTSINGSGRSLPLRITHTFPSFCSTNCRLEPSPGTAMQTGEGTWSVTSCSCAFCAKVALKGSRMPNKNKLNGFIPVRNFRDVKNNHLYQTMAKKLISGMISLIFVTPLKPYRLDEAIKPKNDPYASLRYKEFKFFLVIRFAL